MIHPTTMQHGPVQWRQDGAPESLRFGDVYRPTAAHGGGGLAQARAVFLSGCDLLGSEEAPAAWSNRHQWCILETGFGLGLNFLATWQAWQQDPHRPQRLFYTAIEGFPPDPDDLIRSASPWPQLASLAKELADRWRALLPGMHRLLFESEQIVLTLLIGQAPKAMRDLSGQYDSVYLDGFAPDKNPQMWELDTIKAVTRLTRPGARAASWCVARSVRDHLTRCGFVVQRVPGLPPKRHALRARYQPGWQLTRRTFPITPPVTRVGHCAVVGGGLAGASVAWSLAQRGWRVTVLDQAPQPAAGASAVPAALLVPHVSPDDCSLSRLTRAGVAATLQRAQQLLRPGVDFAQTGVLQRCKAGQHRLPNGWQARPTSTVTQAPVFATDSPSCQEKLVAAGFAADSDKHALWHAQAAWIKPGALVAALLNTAGIRWQGNRPVAGIVAMDDGWQLLGSDKQILLNVDLVVVAAAQQTRALVGHALSLTPLAGQVAFGPMPATPIGQGFPPFPINGAGHLMVNLPGAAGRQWVIGSTFERHVTQPRPRVTGHQQNLERLRQLHPPSAKILEEQWHDGQAQAWAGVRATTRNHLPIVGAWQTEEQHIDHAHPKRNPVQLCTGLGVRGATFAVLCAEVLAAALHDEPLPIETNLVRGLSAQREQPKPSKLPQPMPNTP